MDHPLLSSFLRFSIFSPKVLEIQPNLFTHWPGTILFHIQVEEMKVASWFPTLWDPMDYTVHGILQARILEWITFPFSRRSSQPRDRPRSPALQANSLPAEQQGKPKNTGVGSLSLLQQIFPTQESNRGLLLCRRGLQV